MKRLFCLLSLLLAQNLLAQEPCATHVTEQNLDFIASWRLRQATARSTQNLSQVRIPITPHIIRQSDGTGGLTEAQFTNALAKLNIFYQNAGFEFFIPNEINYIDNDDFFDLNSNQESEIGSGNDVDGTINIYFSNSLKSTQALCGYTYLPPSVDRVFVANGCLAGGTLEHELGHYFSLFHTHGVTNNGTTDELVDGSNCGVAGDRVCDTPADPNLAGFVTNCRYTGTAADANGDIYSPMVNNFMSYAPGNCRDDFSTGQYERIREGFENGRAYLDFESSELVARFTSSQTSGCEGDEIRFTESTPLATSFKWTFEGGTPASSNQPNPRIQYENEGTFSVTLEVFAGNNLSSIITEEEYIIIENPLNNSIDYGFESQVRSEEDFSNSFEVVNTDLSFSFEYSPIDRNEDVQSGAIWLDHFNYITETYPNTDYLLGPKYEIEGIRGFSLHFDHAYAQRTANASDSLWIAFRVDCDDSLELLEKLGGESLSTVSPSTESFSPLANHWNSYEAYFPLTDIDYLTLEFVLISKSFNGNNLFLDNIEISPDFLLDAPFNFRISEVVDDELIFRWVDNSVNELGFVLEVSTDDANFTPFDTIPKNTTAFAVPFDDLIGSYRSVRLFALGKNGNKSEVTPAVSLRSALSIEPSVTSCFIYPNPFTNHLDVSFAEYAGQRLRMLTLDGKEIHTIKGSSDLTTLDTSSMKPGIYLVQVISATHEIVFTKKMIKK